MHAYDDLNDHIPASYWALSSGAYEAEARLFVPHQIFVSCTTFSAEDSKRKLENALRTLGFSGELDWRQG